MSENEYPAAAVDAEEARGSDPSQAKPNEPTLEEIEARIEERRAEQRDERMADILRTGKAPAVISRRNDRPRKLRTRNGRIYEK